MGVFPIIGILYEIMMTQINKQERASHQAKIIARAYVTNIIHTVLIKTQLQTNLT